MPNTLTGLLPIVYEALDIVSRELVGFVPSVGMSASAERAAQGQTITAHIAPAAVATDVTPGVTPPNDGDQTIGTVTMTISKARRVPLRWNGEEQKGLSAPGGMTSDRIMVDQVAQGFRTLANEVENDLAGLHTFASRAYGTAGTTPFTFSATKSGFDDIAFTRQILVDNGAPPSDLQCVLGTTAGATMRALGQLNNAEASADTTFLRQGILLPLHGVNVRESGQVRNFVKGTGTAYTSTAAGFAIGTVNIPLITGSGTVLVGDAVTFAGDSNRYVVAVGVAAPGTITLVEPGLRQALPASAVAMTIINNSARNLMFHRNAIALAMRVPARPTQGDMAEDVSIVLDPRSGVSFEIAVYKQYRQVQFEISAAWGFRVITPRHVAILLG